MRHYYNWGGGLGFYSMRNTTDTKLLIHSNTTDASTTFTDSSASGHTVTASGNAQHSTTVAKFGTTAMKFDGNGDYLSISNDADFSFGEDPFTIDMWIYFSALPTTGNQQAIYYHDYNGTTIKPRFILSNSSGTYTFSFVTYNTSGGSVGGWTWTGAAASTWFHLAFIRGWAGTSTSFMVTINGKPLGSASTGVSAVANNTDNDIIIGGYTLNYFNGYIDELRVVKGVAMWTGQFIPPAGPYS